MDQLKLKEINNLVHSRLRIQIAIEKGWYFRHFKGNLYKPICISKHTETGELMVIYSNMNSPSESWARPLDMFFDWITRPEYSGPRFVLMRANVS